MRTSVRWLNDYLDRPVTPDEAAEAYARVRRDAPEWTDATRGLSEALRRAALPALAADVGGQLQH